MFAFMLIVLPNNAIAIWAHGKKTKKTSSVSGQTIRRAVNKPPCLVGLSKCLLQKTVWNHYMPSRLNLTDGL